MERDDPASPERRATGAVANCSPACRGISKRSASSAWRRNRPGAMPVRGNLADELERFLAGNPVAAVPLGDGERIARLASRDGYEIASEIGRGPRSVAYRALDGPLKQPVVLKVFARGACTREEWEARTPAQRRDVVRARPPERRRGEARRLVGRRAVPRGGVRRAGQPVGAASNRPGPIRQALGARRATGGDRELRAPAGDGSRQPEAEQRPVRGGRHPAHRGFPPADRPHSDPNARRRR